MSTTVAEPRMCGRIAPKARPLTLHLANYLDAAAVDLPSAVDWTKGAEASLARTYLNTKYGCCVISADGHLLGFWTASATGSPILATDDEIANIYFYFSPNDTGCVITQVLDFWAAKGLKLGGLVHKIAGYVAVDWRSKDLIRWAIDALGGVKLGCSIPRAWTQAKGGDTWTVPTTVIGRQIVGGHAFPTSKYDDKGVYVASWGLEFLIPWDVLTGSGYFDEAYAVLSPDFSKDGKLAASGLALADLEADLAKLSAGTVPPIAVNSPLIDWATDWA